LTLSNKLLIEALNKNRMSDESASDDESNSAVNINSMPDDELREWHVKKCERDSGWAYWSHAFDVFEYDGED